jgi:beta-carotene 3-hydroxylase
LELNDVFPAVFASISIGLFLAGLGTPGLHLLVPAAVGMTAYGAVYFFIHDLYIHRRARWLRLRLPLLFALKKAHAIHHRDGGEPYGLLFFVTRSRLDSVHVTEDQRV